MQRLRRLLVAASVLTACEATPVPAPASETGSSSDATTGSTSDPSDASDSDTGTDTEAELEVSVQWIEVAASDYKLELQPEFETEVSDYTALADGPDITVYVDVIVDADVDGVLVNDIPAALVGFRTWRSADQTELVSPTVATVEVLARAARPPIYTIDVTVPGG